MFKSISNNFGAPQIDFDDYQSDNLTVLNAHFDIDPTKPEYEQISQFEIKVPTLIMKKSATTAVFLHTDEKRYHYGTILKSWIKDANTIVIEKHGDFEKYGTLHIDIVSAYVTLGYRGAMAVTDRIALSNPSGEVEMTLKSSSATIKDGWMHLFIRFKTKDSLSSDKQHIYTFEGLPENTDCIVPFVFSTGIVQTNGSSIGVARIHGNEFIIQQIPGSAFTSNEGTFINAFIVRKNIEK